MLMHPYRLRMACGAVQFGIRTYSDHLGCCTLGAGSAAFVPPPRRSRKGAHCHCCKGRAHAWKGVRVV
jgi:hypothetical protein